MLFTVVWTCPTKWAFSGYSTLAARLLGSRRRSSIRRQEPCFGVGGVPSERIPGVFPLSGKAPDGPAGPRSGRVADVLYMSTGVDPWEVLWGLL